ncbi:kinase-like domain-containing protein [Gigaspora rosea]|uniref:Kinase-like domain-containing protein n=1 Tax=Gigaspora rosea TaxID=44941 RepID=A0A397W6B1_9GLOM|nr:kinase-like domain-containing protein [Gigaspora rosea]
MIVLDLYCNKRNFKNGTCKHCKRFNTSPAWCQSCDPWRVTRKFTSGNEEIDNFIKDSQTKATEYDNVIEWIPFNRLDNLQEIKDKSDLVFMATWKGGIRRIIGESGSYTQSRAILCVELMKLYCSNKHFESYEKFQLVDTYSCKFENHMKYRVHGITQNSETNEYLIVLDFYSKKRDSISGICKQCDRYNTHLVWCQSCDPWEETQGWTSNDKNIDDCIKEFQLKATAYEKWLEGSGLEVYGLTQHTETGQYMMVYQYADKGNLHDFLTKNFRKLVWQKKLNQLAGISYDLSKIHSAEFIHNDFHSGNILLHHDVTNENIVPYITDLGLSRKQDEYDSKEGIYGIMPYVTPEILKGQQHTKEADIYGLGVIMAEISTGIRPHEGREFNTKLALDIFDGLRPEFAIGTPDCYIELANQCMDSNPQNRPTAEYVFSKIERWKSILEFENLTVDIDIDIKKKFTDADDIIKISSLKSSFDSQNKYYSRSIDVQSIMKSYREYASSNLEFSQDIGFNNLHKTETKMA